MLSDEELIGFRKHLQELNDSQDFPDESEFQDFLDKSIHTLENEDSSYRPRDSEEMPGGLIDFSDSTVPVVIVPDIHARSWFLLKILDFKIDGDTVLSLLNKGKLIAVCVGDAVHSESRAFDRWVSAYREWSMNIFAGPNMQQEMKENLAVLRIIMALKNTFTSAFHFLKGNHENVLNENGGGNLSFRKFVQEGCMCRDFIRQVYGDAVLHLMSLLEKRLPVCAVFSDFGVSHAEPADVFKRERIIDYHKNCDVILGLTWTANDSAVAGSVAGMLRELCPGSKRKGAVWFGGHRPVRDGKYHLRQNGAYVQIHNPDEMNIAVVTPGKKFNPDKDIKSVF